MSPVAAVPAESAALRTVCHKFGGTSVADADRYRHVAQLLLAREEEIQITVVSAMKGVTDALIELAKLAASGDEAWRERWHELRARHRAAAVSLLGEQVGGTIEWLDARFERLAEILAALAVIGELPQEVLDRVQGLGDVDTLIPLKDGESRPPKGRQRLALRCSEARPHEEFFQKQERLHKKLPNRRLRWNSKFPRIRSSLLLNYQRLTEPFLGVFIFPEISRNFPGSTWKPHQ